ncbi:MAG: PIG-L family deacetylase [Candidatus Hydrogenedentes bacterium]|nr:PIG-L family deacetylase [Candidatus Hydrogenedentota bacterium]
MNRSLPCLLAALLFAASAIAAPEEQTVAPEDRIENWTGKTVLVFTPHPDDDTFACGGTMAILAKNKNNVIVVIYTNDDKGSLDLEMTSERLARIRKAEEEKACEILGIPKENIHWLGYEDGNLEYADPQHLRGEAARYIKQYRPDAIFTIDPGSEHERWHKTDHRMAAFITQDAFIASEWHLYYPQHLLVDGLKPYRVPVAYYYYTTEPNYTVDLSAAGVWEKKADACAAHVSQFEPSLSKYTPEMSADAKKEIVSFFEKRSRDGERFVERFRRLVEP